MIQSRGHSRRGHGPGGRTAGSSVRTCLSLHRDEVESDSLPAHDVRLRTSADRTWIITWTRLVNPPIHPHTRSACPSGIRSKPCPKPFLPIWIYPPYRHPLFCRYIDLFVATILYPSDLLLCATETGTLGFSLCPPVSVRQSRLAPCAELPPMQGQSSISSYE